MPDQPPGSAAPDRYLHGAYHPNGHCPNGVCATDVERLHEHTFLFGVCIGNDCNVKEWEAEEPSAARCAAMPDKPESAWWMNVDQYAADACRCRLPLDHDGPHECEHAAWEVSLAY